MPDELSVDVITLVVLVCIFLCAFLCDRDFERRVRKVAKKGVSGGTRGTGSLVAAVCVVLCLGALAVRGKSAKATTLSFTGNLRSDATYTSCGVGCSLGSGDSDADYAQFAAVVDSFSVTSALEVRAVTLSYGGGVNVAGRRCGKWV